LKSEGYTLIELLVVLILVSIFAVMVVPRWTATPNLDAEAESLLSRLRYTQALALTQGEPFRLNVTLPNLYGITRLNGIAVPDLNTGHETLTFSSGVTVAFSSNLPNHLIAFDQKGAPYFDAEAKSPLSSNASILLTSGDESRRILITAETGNMVITS
jgi:prepilin-type N-terminal cleavage/methylation domain-containing protein